MPTTSAAPGEEGRQAEAAVVAGQVEHPGAVEEVTVLVDKDAVAGVDAGERGARPARLAEGGERIEEVERVRCGGHRATKGSVRSGRNLHGQCGAPASIAEPRVDAYGGAHHMPVVSRVSPHPPGGDLERGRPAGVDEEIAMTEGFSGKRAAEIVGITYRQLDYWARTDLIRPALADAQGSGSRRLYSYRNLLELKVIKTLLDAGIKLESVRGAFSYLRENLGEDVASAQLVICGTSAVLVRDGQELIDVVNRTRARGCSTCSPSTTCAARWTTPSRSGPATAPRRARPRRPAADGP